MLKKRNIKKTLTAKEETKEQQCVHVLIYVMQLVIKPLDEDKLPLPVAHYLHCSPGHRRNDRAPKDLLHLFQREVSAVLPNHS